MKSLVIIKQAYVILCWNNRLYHNERPPDAILGPFTHRQALHQADQLTCQHKIRKITTEAPEWTMLSAGAST